MLISGAVPGKCRQFLVEVNQDARHKIKPPNEIYRLVQRPDCPAQKRESSFPCTRRADLDPRDTLWQSRDSPIAMSYQVRVIREARKNSRFFEIALVIRVSRSRCPFHRKRG